MKKYEFTDEVVEVGGVTLHRIRSLVNIPDTEPDAPYAVEVGDLGGFIASEDNLSHEGSCWVYDNAKVYENAKVYGNAKVCGYARVWGNARVFGNATVENASVYDNAWVYGTALVNDYDQVFGYTRVRGTDHVCQHATVRGSVEVSVTLLLGAILGSMITLGCVGMFISMGMLC